MSGRMRAILFLGFYLLFAQPLSAAVRYTAGESRDPFFEISQRSGDLTASGSSAGAWTLESLLVSPGRRQAVINGRKMSEGDFLDDAEIIRIDKKGVFLKRGDKQGYLTRSGISWS